MLSRSNSVSSIVSTYASSPEPLTSDFIFQPKENESQSFRKHSSGSVKHSATVLVSNPPASPSSELGSEPTSSVADIDECSGAFNKQNPEKVLLEEENDDDEEEEIEEDSDSVIVVDQVNNNCIEVGSSISVASIGTVTTSSGISSREQRDKTPSPPPSPPPPSISHPVAEEAALSAEPVKRRSKLSAEIEALLQYNRNMAPTTTKLPGRQTNNSLSSVTGPVILPFAETPPKTPSSSSGSKSGESNSGAAGGGGGGGNTGTSSSGRKKKSKASEV